MAMVFFVLFLALWLISFPISIAMSWALDVPYCIQQAHTVLRIVSLKNYCKHTNNCGVFIQSQRRKSMRFKIPRWKNLRQMFAFSVANVCLVCGKCLPCLRQMFALSVANVCLVCAKCLPCLCQLFVLSVPNVCLVCANCLPCLWQMFALSVAKVCLVCGKCLSCLWQMFALSVANVCLVCGKCLPCLWQMFALSLANDCLVFVFVFGKLISWPVL